jgi:hypothetical protein
MNDDDMPPVVEAGIEVFAAIVATVLIAAYFRPWVEQLVGPPIKLLVRALLG